MEKLPSDRGKFTKIDFNLKHKVNQMTFARYGV